jgi:putative intracellular protease/amidase
VGAALIVMTSVSEIPGSGRRTGAWLPEVAFPYFRLRESGMDVELATVRGGEAPLDGYDAHDPTQRRLMHDAHARRALRNTRPVDDVCPERDALVLFAGGHGTMWDFRGPGGASALAERAHEAGAVIGAVCCGPMALVDARARDGRPLVAGRRMTCFSNQEEARVGLLDVVPDPLAPALTRNGALVSHQARWQPHVQVDGRIVTGQNPASITALVEEMLQVHGRATEHAPCRHDDVAVDRPHLVPALGRLYYLVRCRRCGHEALRSAAEPDGLPAI